MDTDRPMEMVRLPRKEHVFDREAILGRDAASVFPSQAQKAKQEQMEELKKAVGLDGSRFITESQLEVIKKTRGGTVEDGAVPRDKTLAAILAENRAKKEEAFQGVWKTMKQGTSTAHRAPKTSAAAACSQIQKQSRPGIPPAFCVGKNRPLDEDDLAFVNNLVDSEQAKERSIKDAERSELESFQEAVRRAAEQRQQTAGSSVAAQEDDGQVVKPQQRRSGSQPVVRVKQKTPAAKRVGSENPNGEAIKRHRAEEEKPPNISDPSVLAGLMGGYASDSESDS